MNDLTMRLLAEGYDKDNHPDYVRWSSWQDFEYTPEALSHKLWEAPCGVITKSGSYNHGSHLGVDYCPENDNPRYGCPYGDKSCEHYAHNHSSGWNCTFHQIVRDYDYEISLEKFRDDRDKRNHKAWQEATGGVYCVCIRWDSELGKYGPQYSVDECIERGCCNQVCLVTGKTRNLQKVNIYYDVLREWRCWKGLFETVERKLEKGVRQFKKAVARTDAETWLRQYGKFQYAPVMLHSEQWEAMLDRDHFGYRKEYDRYEYSMTVQNIRIESRARRDLAQDLADIAEGIEVVHASDLVKQKQQAKRERREKRLDAKSRRADRDNIASWVKALASPDATEVMKRFSRESLKKLGLDSDGKPLPPTDIPEQVVLDGVA